MVVESLESDKFPRHLRTTTFIKPFHFSIIKPYLFLRPLAAVNVGIFPSREIRSRRGNQREENGKASTTREKLERIEREKDIEPKDGQSTSSIMTKNK